MRQFYRKWYTSKSNRIILCGINPGKKGEGKIEILFVDYNSVSQLLEGAFNEGWEPSAQFIYSIIEKFGGGFFEHI